MLSKKVFLNIFSISEVVVDIFGIRSTVGTIDIILAVCGQSNVDMIRYPLSILRSFKNPL